MAGFALNLSGLENLQNKLKKLENNLKTEVALELSASTMNIEKGAKRRAPVNLGTLRQSIHAVSSGPLTHMVVAQATYAPYVEFGTGGKVQIPPGYESFAAQYKGKGSGSLEDMIQALTLWVKRKGLAGTYSVSTQKRTGGRKVQKSQDEKLARFLAIKILRNGLRAQPFLIPAYEDEKPKLFQRLKKLIDAKS